MHKYANLLLIRFSNQSVNCEIKYKENHYLQGIMCGICLSVRGIGVECHTCNFNLLERYAQNAYVENNEVLRNKYLNQKFDFIQNLRSKNLYVNDFTLKDIQTAIGPRGPNAFTHKTFTLSNSKENQQRIINHKSTQESFDLMSCTNEKKVEGVVQLDGIKENERTVEGVVQFDGIKENERTVEGVVQLDGIIENERKVEGVFQQDGIKENERTVEGVVQLDETKENERKIEGGVQLDETKENERKLEGGVYLNGIKKNDRNIEGGVYLDETHENERKVEGVVQLKEIKGNYCEKMEGELQMTFCSSLLHLRGDKNNPSIQPLVSKNGNVLIYNGELFEVKSIKERLRFAEQHADQDSQDKKQNEEVQLMKEQCEKEDQENQTGGVQNSDVKNGLWKNEFDPFQSDTEQLFERLNDLCDNQTNYNNLDSLIAQALSEMEGDYAFAYFHEKSGKLYIAKDPFGKRSLLIGFSRDGFVLSSCSLNVSDEKLVPLPDDELEEEGESGKVSKDLVSEFDLPKGFTSKELCKDLRFDMKVPEERVQFLEKKYLHDYIQAKEKEWIELPHNTLIVVDMRNTSHIVWNALPIDNQLYKLSYQLNANTKPLHNAPLESIQLVTQALRQSVQVNVQNIMEFKHHFAKFNSQIHGFYEKNSNQMIKKCNDYSYKLNNITENFKEFTYSKNQTDSKICVLFSGGLDSTLLTILLDQLLPPNESIDLLNLSFKADASDRLTALSAIDELHGLNPNRKYNLILIDKTVEDLSKYEKNLMKLIYPRITHMDFNIALVLHLATQANGYLHTDKELKTPITSGSQVILSGLGADEIFGGYSRYRVAFQRNGYPDLVQEMKFDLQRLWIRNLGRDDRAISQNGREVRFPFLNQNLISVVTEQVDFAYFTDFNMPRGSGDKILLRQVAKSLGLILTSGYRKKAIQFGTGIAKQSNIRTFGSNRKAKGSFKYGLKDTK